MTAMMSAMIAMVLVVMQTLPLVVSGASRRRPTFRLDYPGRTDTTADCILAPRTMSLVARRNSAPADLRAVASMREQQRAQGLMPQHIDT
jgi:hypothetical protein